MTHHRQTVQIVVNEFGPVIFASRVFLAHDLIECVEIELVDGRFAAVFAGLNRRLFQVTAKIVVVNGLETTSIRHRDHLTDRVVSETGLIPFSVRRKDTARQRVVLVEGREITGRDAAVTATRAVSRIAGCDPIAERVVGEADREASRFGEANQTVQSIKERLGEIRVVATTFASPPRYSIWFPAPSYS